MFSGETEAYNPRKYAQGESSKMVKSKSRQKGSCNFYAYSKKHRAAVRWLGCTSTKPTMEKRLRKYAAPSHVIVKKGYLKQWSPEVQKRRVNKWLSEHGMQTI